MRIAYTTTFDAKDLHNWSGTPFYMSNALEAEGMQVNYIGNLQRKLAPFFKTKQFLKKYLAGQRESPRFNLVAAQHYSQQAALSLASLKVDAIISPQINPIAYLETSKPIILWTDAVYAALIGFYPAFANHSAQSIAQGNEITRECLSRCRLAVFSSDWAANSALELYGVSKEKVKVIPFGANIQTAPTYLDVQTYIKKRSRTTLKLLFLAKSWERKGGDIVLNVAKALHERGQAVELHIVGYNPKLLDIPPYVKIHGFLSKQTSFGRSKLHELLTESHFLFVPSRAEAYGIVFCEANAYALPCLTTYIGGIATVVKNHINGMTFGLDASTQTYCDYILSIFNNPQSYDRLALSSYDEYASRLNWQTAVKEMRQLIGGL